MKQLFWKLITYLANVHRSDKPESAGRFYGGIGLGITYVCIPVYAFMFKEPDIMIYLAGIAALLILGKGAESALREIMPPRRHPSVPAGMPEQKPDNLIEK